jgi:hypothetical protein
MEVNCKSKSKNIKESLMDQYIAKIESKFVIEYVGPLKKINNEVITEKIAAANLLEYNYNVAQLKDIAKIYHVKLSGNKKELISRIYLFLKMSVPIIKIQKVIKGFLQRKLNKLHGPAYKNRSSCTNDRDFLSDELLINVSNNQFFSYTDIDNFTYGFDMVSFYNLIIKSDGEIKNPYNRNIISNDVLFNFKRLISISKILKKNINIQMETTTFSPEKNVELKIIEFFQKINSLGNYSEFKWFLDLNKQKLIRFTRELADIWYYRAQITDENKQLICPQGDPFQHFNFNYLNYEQKLDKIRFYILLLLEKMISGVNKDNKSLGTYYILGALTLVNSSAAISLPWLYESFAYF